MEKAKAEKAMFERRPEVGQGEAYTCVGPGQPSLREQQVQRP